MTYDSSEMLLHFSDDYPADPFPCSAVGICSGRLRGRRPPVSASVPSVYFQSLGDTFRQELPGASADNLWPDSASAAYGRKFEVQGGSPETSFES